MDGQKKKKIGTARERILAIETGKYCKISNMLASKGPDQSKTVAKTHAHTHTHTHTHTHHG